MQFDGHVENGVVVFDEQIDLVEGTKVKVEVASPILEVVKPKRTLAERYAAAKGIAPDLTGDMAEQHDFYIHGTQC